MVLLTVALALAGCGDERTRAQPTVPAPAVVVAAVQRAAINPRTEYVGQTAAVDTVDLRARVQAFLMRRVYKEGDDVKQGALLFVLEREPFEAAVDAAAARVAQARAEVVRTRRDLERTRALYARGNVSQQSLDRAISDQDQAEATLRAGEAQLRQARIDLGYTQVTAPFDGRIGRSAYSVGQWVGPDSGVLATLVKLDPIYVVFNVSERSYLDYQERVTQAAREGGPRPEFVPRLRLSSGFEYPHTGRFDFVDNRVDPSTGTIAVRAVFRNPDKLLVPGCSSPSCWSRRRRDRPCWFRRPPSRRTRAAASCWSWAPTTRRRCGASKPARASACSGK
jgi:membrane fusion protein (multidrug efflux system)